MENCILAFDCVKVQSYWPVGSNTDLFLVKTGLIGNGIWGYSALLWGGNTDINCCFLTFFVFWGIVFNMYTAVDDTINVLSFCKSLFWYKISPKRTFCLWTYRVVYSFPEAEALWAKRVHWTKSPGPTRAETFAIHSAPLWTWFSESERIQQLPSRLNSLRLRKSCSHSFSINHQCSSAWISITQECGLMSPNQV